MAAFRRSIETQLEPPIRAAIAAYYRTYRQGLVKPERRAVDTVVTKTRADAARARRALADGLTI